MCIVCTRFVKILHTFLTPIAKRYDAFHFIVVCIKEKKIKHTIRVFRTHTTSSSRLHKYTPFVLRNDSRAFESSTGANEWHRLHVLSNPTRRGEHDINWRHNDRRRRKPIVPYCEQDRYRMFHFERLFINCILYPFLKCLLYKSILYFLNPSHFFYVDWKRG